MVLESLPCYFWRLLVCVVILCCVLASTMAPKSKAMKVAAAPKVVKPAAALKRPAAATAAEYDTSPGLDHNLPPQSWQHTIMCIRFSDSVVNNAPLPYA